MNIEEMYKNYTEVNRRMSDSALMSNLLATLDRVTSVFMGCRIPDDDFDYESRTAFFFMVDKTEIPNLYKFICPPSSSDKHLWCMQVTARCERVTANISYGIRVTPNLTLKQISIQGGANEMLIQCGSVIDDEHSYPNVTTQPTASQKWIMPPYISWWNIGDLSGMKYRKINDVYEIDSFLTEYFKTWRVSDI